MAKKKPKKQMILKYTIEIWYKWKKNNEKFSNFSLFTLSGIKKK